jgi:NADH dehydrogenase
VVGAGFGGLAAAKGLADAPVDVTIVDHHNFHTFQPLLYQVATAGLNAADVAYAVRGIFQRQHNVAFRLGEVTGADWDTRTLLLDGGETSVPFDYLVLAAGATTNFFGVEGAEANAFPLYGLADAVALRNHILDRFEAADAEPSLVDDGALTFVVVGGGATGVEVAGALAELFDMVLRKDFHHVDVSRARVILVEMADHLLPPFRPASQRHALETLASRGVEVLLSETVAAIEPTRVVLRSGRAIAAHTVVWAAGVRASPVATALGLPTLPNGRVEVGPDLRVVDRPQVYAVGDVAATNDTRVGVLPQLAPVAMQSGRHAARQIVRAIEGRPGQPFRYRDKGTMATIGRRAAVAELPGGIDLKGTPAWLAWLGLHLIYLIGFRNRLSVLVNWGWNYLTWDRGPRLIFGRPVVRPAAPSATPRGAQTTRR